MNDEFTINITIAEIPFALTIKKEEEELVRKAAVILNKKLLQYREAYAKDPSVDIFKALAMSSFDITYAYLRLKETHDIETFTQQIDKLSGKIELFLEK